MRSVTLSVLLIVLLSGCSEAIEPELVRITTADGFELAGTWWAPEDADEGVVVFNECGPGISQDRYTPLAEALSKEGYAVLTHDYRGTGRSKTVDFDIEQPDHVDAIRSKFGSDTRNLLGYAMTRYEIVGVVGASCGSYRLADLSEDLSALRAFVSLSGGGTESGTLKLQVRPEVHVLGIASTQDANAMRSVQELVQTVGENAELHSVPGTLHGAELVAMNEGVVDRIVTFVDESVSSEPVRKGPMERMESFSALYTQSGLPMALSVSNPTPGMTRAVMQMQLPGNGRILADSIEHSAQGTFMRRSFDFLGETHERILAGVVGDSLMVLRQPIAGGAVTRSSQPLQSRLVDGTWSYWMLGTMDLATADSVALPTWRMLPAGPIQVISIFNRSGETEDCTWWDARGPAFTLRSCITQEPPYLLEQEAVMPDGSRQPVLKLQSLQ